MDKVKNIITTKTHPLHKKKKLILWIIGSVLTVVALLLLTFRISPWPGALLIRYVFTQNDIKTTQALAKHTPPVAITTLANQSYRSNDNNALLDAYFPESITGTDKKLPLVIWTHGGAWVSGGKGNNAPYYKLIAAENFVVISADYSLGPEKTYPTALHQLNDMHAYILANAERLHVDTNKIILAGDSAGAQLSSQMATIITNPAYASEMSITPSLNPSQLRGVALNCGIYKMDELIHPDPTLPKLVGWGDDVSVWAYLGTRDFTVASTLTQMSAYYHATSTFPTTYITGGNGDPLTNAQSKPFADKLESMGVKVTRLFYPDNHQPSLPHEYQFNLDNDDGKNAFQAIISFFKML